MKEVRNIDNKRIFDMSDDNRGIYIRITKGLYSHLMCKIQPEINKKMSIHKVKFLMNTHHVPTVEIGTKNKVKQSFTL